MPQHHARTGIAHHALDTCPHVRLVAVNGTPLAGRLLDAKGTTLKPPIDVIHQRRTVRAWRTATVVISAIQSHHRADCLPFQLQIH